MHITKTSLWTSTVRNQKAGKIVAFYALEIGAAKWCKERIHTFLLHNKGAILVSATFTSDWYLRVGESRDKLGEWLQKTAVSAKRYGHAHGGPPPLLAPDSWGAFSTSLSQVEFHLPQGEKCLRTIWDVLGEEFSDVFNLCSAQSGVAARTQEMKRPLTPAELMR